ncbi:MAG: 1-acyl-sn-glycerol-3-phosphate acyltransferase [Saprospiraceae bacterium]
MKFSLRHKSTGSAYPYLSQLSPAMYIGFFQKVYVNNQSRVVANRPVLLAANHPTAFVDPCLLCTYLDPPLYNMTRGDLFKKPLFRNLMESINMFPVYRTRDGFNQRHKNDAVFDFCVGKLKENQVVTIYVEGEHHLEKRVRPVHKGIALIAFRSYFEEGLTDLEIVPAGCNYVYGDKPRDSVMVNFGAPLYLRDYEQRYLEDANKASITLCADIEKALKGICYHVDDPADMELAEQQLELHRSNRGEGLLPVVQYNHPRFAQEKAVLDQLNALPADEKAGLRVRTAAYFAALNNAGLEDFALCNAKKGHWSWMLYFVLMFPVFLLGYITALPVLAASWGVTRRFVTKREFVTSVWMGVGFLFGLVYYGLWLIGCLISWNPWWIAFGLLMPLLGWYNMHYREHFGRWWSIRLARRHPDRAGLMALRVLATLVAEKSALATEVVALSATEVVALSATEVVALSATEVVPLSATEVAALSATEVVPLSATEVAATGLKSQNPDQKDASFP